MDDRETERVRGVSYTGFSRDIVGAGFVGEIVTKGQAVEIEFKPNTREKSGSSHEKNSH